MTRRVLMYERPYYDRSGERSQLLYYLLIDQVFFGCNSLDVYGVRVEHYQGDRLLGFRAVRGITPFGPRATALVNRLADGLILPASVEKMLPGGSSCR